MIDIDSLDVKIYETKSGGTDFNGPRDDSFFGSFIQRIAVAAHSFCSIKPYTMYVAFSEI